MRLSFENDGELEVRFTDYGVGFQTSGGWRGKSRLLDTKGFWIDSGRVLGNALT